MRHRARELAERRAELQLLCAAQRHALRGELQGIERRLQLVDRAVGTARSVARNPAVLAAAVAALWMLGRAGGVRLVGRGLLLATATRRLARVLLTP